jgi:hypothetical protein
MHRTFIILLLSSTLCACMAKRKEQQAEYYEYSQRVEDNALQGSEGFGYRGYGTGGGGSAEGMGGYGSSTELDFESYELEADLASPMGLQAGNTANGQTDFQREKGKIGKQAKKDAKKGQSAAAMIHYNGYALLRVARVEEGLDSIAVMAREAGGKLETRGENRITVRIPREGFEEFFAAMLGLGDVMRKSITAEDVSEAFTSVDLRLKTSKATRERLLQLLEKAEEEEEKIRILQQIQRLNEQIDTMEAELRTLRGLAEMSRVTVELVPRQAVSGRAVQQESTGFGWINWLTPFSSTVCQEAKRLPIETPEGLVSLNRKGPYVAESADGAVLRACTVPNQPQGDSVFWQKALQERLAESFATAEPLSIGGFAGVRLVEEAQEPYIYYIGARAEKGQLHLVELYYPSQEQEDRYHPSISDAIEGGGS